MSMDGSMKSQKLICRVCGDKAFGRNFNAITCESCKAFFRRNAINRKQYKCQNYGECIVNIQSRSHCKRCRMEKCFSVGMKYEKIVPEYENLMKNANIDGNSINNFLYNGWNVPESVMHRINSQFDRNQSKTSTALTTWNQIGNPKPQARISAMPQQPVSATTTKPDHIPSPQTIEKAPVLDDQQVSTELNWTNSGSSQELVTVNHLNVSSVPLCNSSLHVHPNIGVNNIIRDTIWLRNPAKEVLDVVASAKNSELAKQSGTHDSNFFTTIEAQKLNELICAYPDQPWVLQTIIQNWPYFQSLLKRPTLDIVNFADCSMRRLIKFSKNVKAFKHLCEEDQLALLKGCCSEMVILKSAITYDSEKGGWKFFPIVLYMTLDQLMKITVKDHEVYKKFVQSFESAWKTDETIIMILSMIILLTPTRPNILHRTIVQMEQHSYYFLLQRYLESKHPVCEAKVQFMKLIQTIQEIKNVNTGGFKGLLNANPNIAGPLLAEIFDLPL